MFKKKSSVKDKAAPFAAGAVVTVGAMVGVAVAKALSDKKTRTKIIKDFDSAKTQAGRTLTTIVGKRGEVLEMAKSQAEKLMPKKAVKKEIKKAAVVRKSTSPVKVATKKASKTTSTASSFKKSS